MSQKPPQGRPDPLQARVLSRRHFVRSTGVAGLAAGSVLRSHAAAPLQAYASATSVRPGGSISFFVSDPAGSNAERSVAMSVDRIGWPDIGMLQSTVRVRRRNVPPNAATSGCNWPATTTLVVPTTWRSGLYFASFGTGAVSCTVPFVVRPAQPAAGTRLLVQVPVTTAQAYNAFGGKSLYGYNSSGGVAAVKVSFDRPSDDPWKFAFDAWQAPFVRWLAKNGFSADFCTSIDLHADPAVTAGYALLALAGHDEYWTREMRQRLDAFVAGGGNVAIFSGNTCWWQARLEAGTGGAPARTLVCYKSRTADPDPRAAYKTDNWIRLQPPDPENSSIGLGWDLGASWTNPLPRPDTPWQVQRNHWVFAGTGLVAGARFGGAFTGYEIDALQTVRGNDGRVYPTGGDAAPAGLTVLAWADASRWDAQARALGQAGEKSGFGAISIHSRAGGQGVVFNAGSIDWALGLQPELDGQTMSVIGRITWNVLTQLGSGAVREAADVRRYTTPQANGDGLRHFLAIGHQPPPASSLVGTAFRAFPAAVPGSVPVYRYRFRQANGDGFRHTYSLNAALGNGWIADGIAFHAYAAPVTGSVPVYQHHTVQSNGDGWRFLFSTSSSEAGWLLDGLAFHALPA